MRVVIPYRHVNNKDLFFAIQSIKKNYLPLEEIIIVGDRPDFTDGYQYIPAKDKQDKEFSIYSKLKRVKGEVLFTNDDIFFMNPMSDIPNYYKGLCGDRTKAEAPYYRRMYARCPPSWLDYDVHCPMVINTDNFEWKHGMPLKSQYGNTAGLVGTLTRDFKVKTLQEIDKTRPFLSITDQISRYVAPLLQELFT